MFRLLVIVAAFAVSGCCPDQIPGGGRPPGGGPSTPPPPTGPTVAGYDLTAAIPLSGLLSGEMILGAALDEGSDRLYLVGSGAVVYTLDLAPPHRTLSVVRLGRSNKVSHPYGVTFTTSATTRASLDYNSGRGPGRARVVRLSAGGDRIFATTDDSAPTPTVLPTDLDLATGITYDRHHREFIFVTTQTRSAGTPELIVMDDGLQRIVRRYLLRNIGIDQPEDVAYSAGRVVVLESDGALHAVNHRTGALFDQANDPAAQLSVNTAVQAHLTYATGLGFGFRAPDLTESPLLITNKPPTNRGSGDKLLILSAR